MTERNYDPDLLPILPLLPDISALSTAEKVQEVRSMGSAMGEPPPQLDDVEREDRVIAGPEGAPDVEVRIHRPKDRSAEALPGVLEIHGGGFMLGSKDMMDPWCDRVAAELGAVVVSTDYRLAPEDPFPAGLEDCYAALCWMADGFSNP